MADPDRFIPDESRRLVEGRERMRCGRCHGPGREWHHRRSRRVRAAHRHCACNGVLLCGTCHRWAHANPEDARATGFVIQQWEDEPLHVPQFRTDGWWVLVCDGTMKPLQLGDVQTDGVGGYRLTDECIATLWGSSE